MPLTVSRNSPSTNVLPSDLETEPDDERRHRVQVRDGDSDMGRSVIRVTWVHPPVSRTVDPLQRRSRRAGLDIDRLSASWAIASLNARMYKLAFVDYRPSRAALEPANEREDEPATAKGHPVPDD